LLIDETGTKRGVVQTRDALKLAFEAGLDLVEVGGTSVPPVCKIMDFGQLKYDHKKKMQEAKKKQTVVKVKELKMRPKIESHDFDVKVKKLIDFINSGYKIRLVVRFRGREIIYADSAKELLNNLYEKVSDISHIEQHPSMAGYMMVMIVAPGVNS
jgi:translation initiation factor IF-3